MGFLLRALCSSRCSSMHAVSFLMSDTCRHRRRVALVPTTSIGGDRSVNMAPSARWERVNHARLLTVRQWGWFSAVARLGSYGQLPAPLSPLSHQQSSANNSSCHASGYQPHLVIAALAGLLHVCVHVVTKEEAPDLQAIQGTKSTEHGIRTSTFFALSPALEGCRHFCDAPSPPPPPPSPFVHAHAHSCHLLFLAALPPIRYTSMQMGKPTYPKAPLSHFHFLTSFPPGQFQSPCHFRRWRGAPASR